MTDEQQEIFDVLGDTPVRGVELEFPRMHLIARNGDVVAMCDARGKWSYVGVRSLKWADDIEAPDKLTDEVVWA